MSKDIRSFFQTQSGSKPKTKPAESLEKKTKKGVITDDDDVIPESPDVRSKSKDKKLKNKRRIVDDSSDEDISYHKTNEKSSKNGNAKPTKKPIFKEVSAVDMFGSGPIKRTEIPKKPKHHKVEAEVTIHSDEDFDKTLLQLDDPTNTTETNKKSIHEKRSTEEIVNEIEISEKASDDKSTGFTKDENQIIVSGKEKHPAESHQKSNESNLSQYKIPKKPTSDVPSSMPLNKKESRVNNEKKRDFSQFIESNGQNEGKPEDNSSSKSKKRKCDQSLNESVISDEERFEKKRHSAMLYKNYLNRSGPANPGSKSMPEGAPNCLKDLAFVLTGVMPSFEKDEITEAIKKYGGTVKSGVSKKVTHVLAGDDAGPAKLAKAEDLGLTIINEDQLLDLIRQQSESGKKDPSKNSQKIEKHNSDINTKPVVKKEKDINKEKDIKNEKEVIKDNHTNKEKNRDKKKDANEKLDMKEDKHLSKDNSVIKNDSVKVNGNDYVNGDQKEEEIELKNTPKKKIKTTSFYKTAAEEKDVQPSTSKVIEAMEISSQSSKDSKSSSSISSIDAASLMWVEKYKPKTAKQIIGQNGEASNVKKLSNWLMRWYINRKEKLSKPSPWAKNDDGGYYKAALLSGPPGIGKTTAVSLVCAELGFDVVELNASDTRSKTLVREQISELLTTNSLAGYVSGKTTAVSLVCAELGFDVVELNASDTRSKTLVREHISELLTTNSLAGYVSGKTTAVSLVCAELGFDVVELNASDTRTKTLVREHISELLTTNSLAGYVSGKTTAVSLVCAELGFDVVELNASDTRSKTLVREHISELLTTNSLAGYVSGKTTAVSLVCAELGFDVVELNASDTRSKTLVREHISELLTTNSLAGYVSGEAGRKAVSKKHVLVMDEVDGMAGNEDRGGLQELIALIKRTSVPIVCTCNDRNSTKMRSLVNYCYDLRFSRPRVDQIKSAMMSVCFKEGVKIPAETLTQLIVSSQQDVRQTLNLLSMWAVRGAPDDGSAVTAKKDVKLGPWEAVRKVFSAEEHKTMSIHDKSDLFFYDYSIAPLFVQENYLQVVPHCPNASGSKSSIFLDYSRHLYDAVVLPLARDKADGIARALEVLQVYHLLREDLDSLGELALWPGRRDPMLMVDSKVKAAMTRAYNREAAALPYAQAAARRARSAAAAAPPDGEGVPSEGEGEAAAEEEGEAEEAESDSDPEHDAMITKKKPSRSGKEAKAETKGGKGKKGKGKG